MPRASKQRWQAHACSRIVGAPLSSWRARHEGRCRGRSRGWCEGGTVGTAWMAQMVRMVRKAWGGVGVKPTVRQCGCAVWFALPADRWRGAAVVHLLLGLILEVDAGELLLPGKELLHPVDGLFHAVRCHDPRACRQVQLRPATGGGGQTSDAASEINGDARVGKGRPRRHWWGWHQGMAT